MKSIPATIEFLTPVHVGSGESISPFEYFIKDSYLQKVNMNLFMLSLNSDKQQELMNSLDRLPNDNELIKIRNFLGDNSNENTIDFKIKVTPAIQKEFSLKIENLENRLEVILFPNHGIKRQPLIPGSSIKGALRTAIVNHFVQEKITKEGEGYKNLFLIEKDDRGKDKRNNNIIHFEKNLFGYKDAKEDFFRAVKLPDIPLDADKTEIIESRIYHLKRREDGVPIKMEVSTSQLSNPLQSKKYNFSFLFNSDFASASKKTNLRNFRVQNEFSLIQLGNASNLFYFQALDYELRKFYSDLQRFSNLNYLRELRKKIQPDQFLIRLGRFGHVESKTVDIIRNPKTKKGWGRTRTLANDQYPLGWAIITIPGMEFAAIPGNLPEPTGIGGGYKEDTRIVREATSNNPQTPRGNENRPKPQQGSGYNQETKKDFGNKSNPSSPQTGSGHFNQLKNINKDKKK
ncbi:MAG: type III-A CRISPR-associated RAMP protein Csm5 [Leptospiraceae bacterium]|nr:type III-A CRISPR-associated RAMP protein Csm5 [Leptospiraceae bacterium]